ncbi:MAG: hypothetical protein HZA19_01575, partial [Nitrospirae bacterium]|nr:hypothetical protein [Nitrospirota bacterium]
TEDRLDVGKFNWIQFFAAGAVTRNVSFFDELEISDAGTVKHGWFILGFHNLTNSPGLVNFQMGKISPVEWTSFSNRLRIFPEIQGLSDKVASSGGAAAGAAEDPVDISSAQPGINYYGYRGPLVWTLGIGNGKNTTDKNQFKNYWGSLRLEVPEGDSPFEGSSVSLFYYTGTDTAATATAQKENNFSRFEPAFNIRWREFDIIGAYLWGEEDNFDLATGDEERFQGVTGIVSYLFDSRVQAGFQYDSIRQRDLSGLEKERLALHLSYLLRENINLILTTDFDLETDRHQYYTTVRSMF